MKILPLPLRLISAGATSSNSKGGREDGKSLYCGFFRRLAARHFESSNPGCSNPASGAPAS